MSEPMNEPMNEPVSERQVVVILGASSGIGRATALAFARQGASLVLAARSADALEQVAAECRGIGAEATAVPTDAIDADAVRALAQAAVERHGGIDVWVNNVGVGAVGRFEDTPAHAHRRVVETNLVGGMNGAHAVLPHFRQRRRGTLIQMVSVGAWMPAAYATAYTASKFGLRGFVEALRAEQHDMPGVQVCAVYPTVVDTPGFEHGANYSGRQLRPGGVMLDARSVADAIVRLARHPRPSLAVGGLARPAQLAHAVAPRLAGRLLQALLERSLRRAPRKRPSAGNLFEPSVGHAIDGGLRPPGTGQAGKVAALAVGGLAVGWWLFQRHRVQRGG